MSAVQTSSRAVAAAPALSLTFDDGPDRVWTSRLLSRLDDCSATGTFFMVGQRVLAEPDVARSVRRQGHDIQLHCHRHIRHTELSEAELRDDTETALEALRAVGARPRLWRTPWGVCTDATRRVAARLDLRLVGWSIDTHDWRGDQPDAMFERLHAELGDGGTVLMHDALGPGARRTGCENTLALVTKLGAAARSGRLRLAPIEQMRAAATA